MKKIEFVKIIAPVAEYYGRTLTDAAIMLYFEEAKQIQAEAFEYLIRMHIRDPEQGAFYPTLAHVLSQAQNKTEIARIAGIAFDQDSSIDGTGRFDRNSETKQQLEIRRKHYVDRQVQLSAKRNPAEIVAYSPNVPIELKREMLVAIQMDHKKKLESL